MIKKAAIIFIILFVSVSAFGSAFIILRKAVESDSSNLKLVRIFIYKHPIANVFYALSRSKPVSNDFSIFEVPAYATTTVVEDNQPFHLQIN